MYLHFILAEWYFSALKVLCYASYFLCGDIKWLFTFKVAHSRVRTGYGILEKLWNFENEIPYMEKLWNLSKTAVPMEKLWNFPNGGKKCVLSLKNGGKIRPDFEMWFQCLLLRLSLH